MQIINLPILAAFGGLFIGCVPFLKGLLFGPEAPLGFLRDCLEVSARFLSLLHVMQLIRYTDLGSHKASIPQANGMVDAMLRGGVHKVRGAPVFWKAVQVAMCILGSAQSLRCAGAGDAYDPMHDDSAGGSAARGPRVSDM